MKKTDDFKEYVFYLSWDLDPHRNGRTQTIWATDPIDAERRLQSWKHFGYTPKYLYPLEEFKTNHVAETHVEVEMAPAVETENV